MAELLLPSEVTVNMAAIEQSAGHVKPAGVAMGIDANPDAKRLHVAEHMPIPEQQYRILTDGSALLALNTAESRLAVARLRPGSIIDLFDKPSIGHARPAVVVSQDPTETRFWTAHNKYAEEWRSYKIAERVHDEVEDVRIALAQLFSLTQGAEATTMLGVAFGLDVHESVARSDRPLSDHGHGAHEEPKVALPQNFVLGNATIRETCMSHVPAGDTKFARVLMTDTGIAPLRTVGTTPEESGHLLNTAFVKVAEQYARAGTSGFGGSQKIAATLEALIIATLELPEQIGNGATARQVRTGVQKRLKINKSF